ncbi:neprosin family prolyl endopeptidase [Lentzea sp.]|uniref:neprosin family prolyl endopeptidase n=1 Tax=Lentzea sp. TaxID=56099 RepID=UPI002CD1AC05|nr:neprosin family prolyl endopeptidase [Lentzea sp.]HUQ54793.1 neprosin family prolyl endopeptidase [Lentzea sp.]
MIQPFEDFRRSLSSVRYASLRENTEVKTDNDAFDEMREFLLRRYDGVDVQHSFVEPGGEVVDCVPVEQQLALRDSSDIPEPPDPPSEPAGGDLESPAVGESKPIPPPLHPDHHDEYGNQMWCPPGTVPVLRHTLERLASDHSTLDDFLVGPKAADNVRRHAVARQETDNLGGASDVNIWSPTLIPPQLLSSASQQWYSTGMQPFVTLQSVECGWRAGVIAGPVAADSLPRLFVFYTRQDYQPSQSCYNDYCAGGFAYTPGASHVLHGALTPVSQPGGTQWHVRMGFTLTQDRWWFHASGVWVGSYPASLFSNGTLSSGARLASFGGETTTGFGSFPPMGSGRFPSEGYGRAAYQRLIGVNNPAGVPVAPQLVPGQVSPACYNVAIATSGDSAWGTHIFFGGPGGLNCP